MHQAFHCELLNKFDVDGAPGVGGLAGSEANCVTVFVEALSNAVDPAEAQRNLYGFGPGDARSSGISLVEADKQLLEFFVMGLEPGAEVAGRCEECWFWWHRVQAQ